MRVEVGGGVREWRNMPTTGTSKYDVNRQRTNTVGPAVPFMAAFYGGGVG